MKNFKDLFDKLFGWLKIDYISHHGNEGNKRIVPSENSALDYHYKVGDFIGQKYEVYDVLGKGGCGIVYLVYSHQTESVLALKTFRNEYLEDIRTRDQFKKEATVWVNLERHPYLVRAYFVEEISGRLFIGMEYIYPDEEGVNSLEGYLQHSLPDFMLSLRWAIQFCHGMEYAYSKGIRCHRDIKPANIMVSQDKTIKISDFGLAGVFDFGTALSKIKLTLRDNKIGLSFQTLDGAVGTPTHMPPEQFINATYCDERSDIYSFGIVLYQMRAAGKVPFLAPLPRNNSSDESFRFWNSMRKLHAEAFVPKLGSRLDHIINRCLEKAPNKRYQSFSELRSDLDSLLKHVTGEVIKPPDLMELEWWEWNNKGGSLNTLGRHEDAMHCFDKAIELNPLGAVTWYNKGHSLYELKKYIEAMRCFDESLKINPRYNAAWNAFGQCLYELGRYEEAIHCYEKALEIDPHLAVAWRSKANSLFFLERNEEAIHCLDKSLEIYPRDSNAWYDKGEQLSRLGRYEEAIRSFEKSLEIDPLNAVSWYNKGVSFARLKHYSEAIACFDKSLEINPQLETAWISKGNSLCSLGRYEEAVLCFEKALEIESQNAKTWFLLGNTLGELGRYQEAIPSYNRALEIDPRDARTWYNKAITEEDLNLNLDAVHSFKNFLKHAPSQDSEQIEYARQRLKELKGK